MTINGMAQFEKICRQKLVEWYNKSGREQITIDDTYMVWSCKTLQNCKGLFSTSVSGDGIYAEYTYNGDKQELYEDIYHKLENNAYSDGAK